MSRRLNDALGMSEEAAVAGIRYALQFYARCAERFADDDAIWNDHEDEGIPLPTGDDARRISDLMDPRNLLATPAMFGASMYVRLFLWPQPARLTLTDEEAAQLRRLEQRQRRAPAPTLLEVSPVPVPPDHEARVVRSVRTVPVADDGLPVDEEARHDELNRRQPSPRRNPAREPSRAPRRGRRRQDNA